MAVISELKTRMFVASRCRWIYMHWHVPRTTDDLLRLYRIFGLCLGLNLQNKGNAYTLWFQLENMFQLTGTPQGIEHVVFQFKDMPLGFREHRVKYKTRMRFKLDTIQLEGMTRKLVWAEGVLFLLKSMSPTHEFSFLYALRVS